MASSGGESRPVAFRDGQFKRRAERRAEEIEIEIWMEGSERVQRKQMRKGIPLYDGSRGSRYSLEIRLISSILRGRIPLRAGVRCSLSLVARLHPLFESSKRKMRRKKEKRKKRGRRSEKRK